MQRTKEIFIQLREYEQDNGLYPAEPAILHSRAGLFKLSTCRELPALQKHKHTKIQNKSNK
jgi:hypothetical protein